MEKCNNCTARYEGNEPLNCKIYNETGFCNVLHKPQSRNFHKTRVTIDYTGSISIAGDWSCNWGCIYPHNIQNFKDGIINPCTGFVVQVIGMDSEVAKTHREYIYDKIRKGYFDHLIEE